MVAAAWTRLWGLPEAPAYPGTAVVKVAAETSSFPEAVPPQRVLEVFSSNVAGIRRPIRHQQDLAAVY